MKVFWLHDYRLKDWIGGAQLTTREMLSKAPIEVEMIYPDSFYRNKIKGYPLILSNTEIFKRSDLEWIAETQNYIRYERDYSFCKKRNALGHDCMQECADTLVLYTQLFQNSVLNIFLSKLQFEVYLKYIQLNKDKVYLQPSPIEVSKFDYNGKKEDLYLAVGEDAWAKGTDLIRKEFASKNFVFIGGENKIPYNDMPKWYHRAKYFVHKPRWIEPFGRAVAEAYCANCILLVNDNIGFLSYPWDYMDKAFVYDQLIKAPFRFWEKVLDYLM